MYMHRPADVRGAGLPKRPEQAPFPYTIFYKPPKAVCKMADKAAGPICVLNLKNARSYPGGGLEIDFTIRISLMVNSGGLTLVFLQVLCR